MRKKAMHKGVGSSQYQQPKSVLSSSAAGSYDFNMSGPIPPKSVLQSAQEAGTYGLDALMQSSTSVDTGADSVLPDPFFLRPKGPEAVGEETAAEEGRRSASLSPHGSMTLPHGCRVTSVPLSGPTAEAASRLDEALQRLSIAVVLCDRRAPGLPIVATNRAFETLTGFPPKEAIGFNCREVLQGSESELPAMLQLSDAVRCGRGCRVVMTNYRQDGSSFLNQITISQTLRLNLGSELVVAVLQVVPLCSAASL